MPEHALRGRQNSKFQYAALAAAAIHGGTEPDLLEEVAWWQADDFWQYALFAAVAYSRAAASRTGLPVRQACHDLAQRPGPQRHNDQFGHSPAGNLTGGAADHNGGSVRVHRDERRSGEVVRDVSGSEVWVLAR